MAERVLNDRTLVRVYDVDEQALLSLDSETPLTLADFKVANEFAADEWSELCADLIEHGQATVGGGAAPTYRIEVVE